MSSTPKKSSTPSQRSSLKSCSTATKEKLKNDLVYLKKKQELDKREKELEIQQLELNAQREIMEKENELQSIEENPENENTSQVIDDDEDNNNNDDEDNNNNDDESILRSLPAENEDEKVERLFKESTPTANVSQNEVNLLARTLLRLKPVNIKKFNGNPDSFAQFNARFMSLEEDGCYSNKELLQILLDSVEGRAEQALKGFLPGTDQYYEALYTLKRRFGQTTQIIIANEAKLREHPKVEKRNPSSLRSLSDTLSAVISTYKSLDLISELASGSNVIQVLEKLPIDMRVKWERDMSSKKLRPNLEDLQNWLEKETSILEKVHSYKIDERPTERHQKDNKRTYAMVGEVEHPPLCVLHQNSRHYTRECEKLKSMQIKDRTEVITTNKLCWLCLKPRHGKCTYHTTCETCQGKHHSLAHDNILTYRSARKETTSASAASQSPQTPKDLPKRPEPNHHSYAVQMSAESKITSLPLVNVTISGPKSNKKTTALIDTGSDTTFMTKSLSSTLGLTGPQDTIILSGINQVQQEKVTILNNVKITSSKGKGVRRKQYSLHRVLVRDDRNFPKLNNQVDWSNEKYKHTHLQDLPLQSTPGDVEMIIGCDQGFLIRPFQVRENSYKDPIAIDTRLGWTVFSNTTTPSLRSNYASYTACTSTELLEQQLTDWFKMEMEPLYPQQTLQSQEDEMASNILTSQTQKLSGEDRYEVPILWKDSSEPLPNNQDQAVRQWMQLEKRLDRDEKLKTAYVKTLHTDLEKGFIKKVPEEELNKENPREQYIVHHPVVHPHKPDKVRRVYNFSSSYQGQSLNDRIYNGPDLLNSLTGVLTRFRTGNICLASDVSDMFLQMQVKPEDENSLRFLFRESSDQPLDIYKCVRRPLGERSAPCCANYAIKKCCHDNITEFPLAAEVAERSFYVDDCLTSVDDKDQAIQLSKDLTQLLAKRSFKLTKWMSNNSEVLETIPTNEQYKGLKSFNDEVTTKTRTLGAVYDPDKDCFITTISQKDPASTPREFLSRIASIWDPLGHLSPFIIRGRNLQRETFTQKLHWDSLVTDPLLTKWRSWEEELLQIQGTEIPRRFRSRQENGESSLVSFSDASKKAKCAVNYIRTNYEDGKVDTRINVARTKLSPQKTVSIPRLELDAFLMSVRLVKSTLKELNLTITRVTFFTDSMIVLYWVKQTSNRYRDYVAHRISDIQCEFKWLEDNGYEVEVRHCPTAENPADDGTRGLTSDKLSPDSRWQLGPKFLKEPESTWPTIPHEEEKIPDTSLEVRKKCFVTTQDESTFPVHRFSTMSKALRVLARCLRWKSKEKGPISSEELTNTQVLLVKIHQKQVFTEELHHLKEGKEVPNKSSIKRLVPFIDEDGIIRARGRLRHAPIAYSAKYPIIIDGKSHLAQLLIARKHEETKHGSVLHVINELRQEYWILKVKQVVKKYTWNCWFCKKERAKPTPPLMADLPPARVTPNTTPFTAVMCDFFGPITVKERTTTRRSIQQKRWGCIFTCLSTRAIHLELANGLSTDTFINCLIRFTSRRGTCTDIYSDRGTNFIGAARELHESLNKDKVINTLQQKGINWHFGSPLSPHKTGAVERLVRSVKRALRSLEAPVFTSDTLHTALVQIEGCLNSRPLTTIADPENPNELRALTPNDLLLLKPDVSVPLQSDVKEVNSRKIYKRALAAAQSFWSRWIKEYLPTLMQRSKWYYERKEPNVGELVLSIEDGVSKHQWPLARVVRVIRSKDQRVRSVILKTKTGTYTRPVVKICRLEDD